MDIIIEEVFLHDDIRGGNSIGFQTYGLEAVGKPIGVIIKRTLLDLKSEVLRIKGYEHIFIAKGPDYPALTAYDLKTIADRLTNHNDRQKKD